VGDGDFVIVVDSQETKYPYLFSGELLVRKPLLVDGIRTGDYSIKGFERKITIERKTLTDLYSSLSTRRIKFMEEMERVQYFDCKVLLIESTYDQVINASRTSRVRKYSKLPRASVLGSLVKINMEFGITVIFAGNRKNGEEWTLHTLKMFYKKKHEGKI
jgi:ERCC4-type nuclease